MLNTALSYLSQNLNVIPCKEKRPLIAWKEFQNKMMTPEQAKINFVEAAQIAVITGAVSQGLEIIDFDLKFFDDNGKKEFWDNFNHHLLELLPEVIGKLQINRTKSGGYHIVYRCEEISKNQKLAKVDVNGRLETVIETRGEGGYFITPPSEGYSFVQGDMMNIPVLEIDERDQLINFCKSYDQSPIQEEKRTNKPKDTSYKESPIDHYNNCDDCLKLLTDHGWKEVMNKGDRIFFRRPGGTSFQSGNWSASRKLFYVFSSGDTMLEPETAYSPAHLYCKLECRGDWKATFKSLLEAGYGEKWSTSEKSVIEKLKVSVNAPDWLTRKSDVLTELPKNWTPIVVDNAIIAATSRNYFWAKTERGVSVNHFHLIEFLSKELGYYLWADSNEDKKPIIKVNIALKQVERIKSTDQLKKDIYDWLIDFLQDSEYDVDEIVNAILTKNEKLFSGNSLEWLSQLSFQTFTDDLTNAYFFFKNGIVKCTKDSIKLTPYSDLPEKTYIWKDRIINHHFNIEIIDDLQKDIYYNSSWHKFIRRISGIYPEHDLLPIEELTPESRDRFLSTMTCLGYMLHSYKDRSKPWIIVVQEDTPEHGQGGGSGKQIITKGLNIFRKIIEEDGKLFDITKQFAFQAVTDDLDIFVIDDVARGFKLEPLYKIASNDMNIEIRNVGRKVIPYERSPKLMLTTNYDLIGVEEANHKMRRMKLLLVDCYFGPKKLPKDELGMLLDRDDWDNEQWQLFYNFMFRSVVSYLKWDVVDVAITNNMIEKSMKQAFGEDFCEFMKDVIEEQSDTWILPKNLYNDFCLKYDIQKSRFSYSKLRKGVETYCDKFKIELEIDRKFRDRSENSLGQTVDKQMAYFIKNPKKFSPTQI